jgi:hypothetical protein
MQGFQLYKSVFILTTFVKANTDYQLSFESLYHAERSGEGAFTDVLTVIANSKLLRASERNVE